MKFASMLRRLRNTQGGMGSTAKSTSTPYTPYTDPPALEVEAGSDQIVSQGDTVKFNGSVVSAPDGVTLKYKWTFDDETNPTAGSNRLAASYAYPTHGLKTATLAVSYTGADGKKVEASDRLNVTVIHIKSREVEDGDSTVFPVLGPSSVLNARTTKFFWDWELPPTLGPNPQVGNTPAVNFSDKRLNPTTINGAKWYAFPNMACPPGSDSASINAFLTSIYTIKCRVTTSDGSAIAEAKLSVSIPLSGGETKNPTLAGFVFDNQSGDSQKPWRLNPKRIYRARPEVTINVNKNSQFYNKVWAHENKHVEQWQTGFMSGYFTVNGFLNFVTNSGVTVRNLKAATQPKIEKLVKQAYHNWYLDEYNQASHTQGHTQNHNHTRMEKEAYKVSDRYLPQYYYQGKCHGY